MKSTKLEIGCGEKRPWREDFVGLDRFPLDGVDFVFDLDSQEPLPFEDNSFSLIYASHTLEHVRDLLPVMQELWRIAKPGGQLCILAPYDHTALNAANPYHHQAFNEHTPRFWTTSEKTRIPLKEYWVGRPSHQRWGLAASDNSSTNMDWRCMNMEFFYFQPFALFSNRKKRRLRSRQRDVCHSLLYHLVAFKPPLSEEQLEALEIDYYIPKEVASLRFSCNEGPVLHALRSLKRKLLNPSSSQT